MDWCKGECTRNHGEDPYSNSLGVSYGFPAIFPWKTHWFRQNLQTNKSESEHRRKSPVLLAKRILDHSCWHRIWNKKWRSKAPSSGKLIHWTMLGHRLDGGLRGQRALHWANDICWQSFQHSLSLLTSRTRAQLAYNSPGLMVDAHIYRIYS